LDASTGLIISGGGDEMFGATTAGARAVVAGGAGLAVAGKARLAGMTDVGSGELGRYASLSETDDGALCGAAGVRFATGFDGAMAAAVGGALVDLTVGVKAAGRETGGGEAGTKG
jgi:hypothetical protein